MSVSRFTPSRCGMLLLILVPLWGGCGPHLDEAQLGKIEYRVPALPAGVKPYRLPDLSPAEPTPQAEVTPGDEAPPQPTPVAVELRTESNPLPARSDDAAGDAPE